MKVWGFKRRIQNLTRNLETISTLVHEKSSSVASNSHLTSMNPDVPTKLNKLFRERLLTSLLREKLYSKELEVEQLHAEVSAAVRGNDILICEVQNAMDNILCLTHRLKDLELQMPKKDEIESRLRNDIQESTKELAILRGVLPKVSQERDLMWEEVKQYAEKNMKKIEGLDEDILLKEGQITILKDTLNNNNKSFDLLGSVDSISEFLLQ
ncbi:golgin IMH1 [Gossypium australe]|uniref:Golgin IMH1 n=1 Tax=Gossypium australe TaxID=47621 RepID=A0A5B6WAG7_9ROSI|nr:golgin IMH1 [Gossypium australe]